DCSQPQPRGSRTFESLPVQPEPEIVYPGPLQELLGYRLRIRHLRQCLLVDEGSADNCRKPRLRKSIDQTQLFLCRYSRRFALESLTGTFLDDSDAIWTVGHRSAPRPVGCALLIESGEAFA